MDAQGLKSPIIYYGVYFTIWLHYLSSLQKADQIPGHFWPGTEYDPNGIFSGSRWRVYILQYNRATTPIGQPALRNPPLGQPFT